MAIPEHAVSTTKLLGQADQLKTSEHSRFLLILKQLHKNNRQLSPAEQQHLQYLDAWQAAYEGNYDQANRLLHALVKSHADAALASRAKALLVHNSFVERHYEQAYTMANSLMADLPKITDATARMNVFSQVIQMLDRVDQYDLALKYAYQMEQAFPSGKGKCQADLYKSQTLLYRGDLTATSPQFRRTIDACRAINEPIYANSMSLDWAGMMNDEGHPDRAIALLRKTTPSIMKAGYQFHIAELHVLLARAWLLKHDSKRARSSALAALKANDSGKFNWTLQHAYEVLYKVARQVGDDSAALAWHEKYMAQYKAATQDAKAQALAYQMVKQDVLAKKLELEKLSKQNRILQLQQSLDHKAVENNRLYMLLLLLVLAFIGLWAYRTKHSQIRFREMAHHDDLTGCLNRKHFLDVAEKTLHHLQKTHTHACLLILDMDHFKQINDTHGHLNGDKVLRHVAMTCREELRASDIYGRLGGEEFGILIPDCLCEQGSDIGRRICHALAATSASLDDGVRVTVTASVGLACTDTAGWDLRQLLTQADQALYGAKRGGRNRLSVHAESTDSREREHGIPT
ncbi:MAG TPA: GGDEF domain-containing protein [Rhodanobacteraceae bacterium]|nr:GGDEF domain-containing protein [Rhodanobacteraceae bacterium]